MSDLAKRASAVEMLVLDVDGVLTDGRIIYSANGDELKSFHVRDGSGLAAWRKLGKRAAIITGRSSPAVARRAAELGIELVHQGVADKKSALDDIVRTSGVAVEQMCAMGDDLPDLPVLRSVGLAVAVADACLEVRSMAAYVTMAPGGGGAVRETIEMLLRSQGQWNAVVESY